jgi:hypothetical protein
MRTFRARALVWMAFLFGCESAGDRAARDAEPAGELDGAPSEAGVSDAAADAAPGREDGGTLEGDAEPSDAASSDGDASGPPDAGTGPSGDPLFVSVGGEDNTPWLYTSCDGRSWTRRTIALPAGHPTGGEGSGLRGVGYGGGTFVVTGGGTVGGQNVRLIGRSNDGVSWQWEEGPSCTDCQWMGGAAWLDDGATGIWIAGGGGGTRLYSRDVGRSWAQSSGPGGLAPYRRFRSAGARAVAAGQGVLSVVELAPAGASEPVVWHDSPGSPHESVFVAAGNGAFVAVWYDDGCRWLRTGSTSWQTCSLPAGRDPVITSVVFGNGKFSILGHGAPIESTDGEHWTLASSGTGTDFRDVAFGDGTYVTSGSYSSDARSWQTATRAAEHGYAQAVGRLASGRSCPE